MRINLLTTAMITSLGSMSSINRAWNSLPFLFAAQSYPVSAGKTGIAAARRQAKRRRRAKK